MQEGASKQRQLKAKIQKSTFQQQTPNIKLFVNNKKELLPYNNKRKKNKVKRKMWIIIKYMLNVAQTEDMFLKMHTGETFKVSEVFIIVNNPRNCFSNSRRGFIAQ